MADTTANKTRSFSRRTVTLFWSALVGTIVITLLIYERIDILYLLATIGLVLLLAIVATANLEGKTNSVNNQQ